jgi:divalent metal cation (Fe/Co/Zn/Cd) transporter
MIFTQITYKLISYFVSILLLIFGLCFFIYSAREWIHSSDFFHGVFGILLSMVFIVAAISIYQSLWMF